MVELTLSAFPRSGTRYFVNAMKMAFPRHRLEDTHRIQTLKQGLRVATIVRDPESCVTSWVQYAGDPIDGSLRWYSQFAEATLEVWDSVYVTLFDDAVSDIGGCISDYASKFGLVVESKVTDRKVKTVMRQEGLTEHLPRQTANREMLITQVRGSAEYDRAYALFRQIQDRAVGG